MKYKNNKDFNGESLFRSKISTRELVRYICQMQHYRTIQWSLMMAKIIRFHYSPVPLDASYMRKHRKDRRYDATTLYLAV